MVAFLNFTNTNHVEYDDVANYYHEASDLIFKFLEPCKFLELTGNLIREWVKNYADIKAFRIFFMIWSVAIWEVVSKNNGAFHWSFLRWWVLGQPSLLWVWNLLCINVECQIAGDEWYRVDFILESNWQSSQINRFILNLGKIDELVANVPTILPWFAIFRHRVDVTESIFLWNISSQLWNIVNLEL